MVALNTQEPQRTAATHNAREAAADSFLWDSVIDRLQRAGVERFPTTIRLAQSKGMTPKDVLEIIDCFEANRTQFNHPGAILDRIREGAWCAKLPTIAGVNRIQRAGRIETSQAIARSNRVSSGEGMATIKDLSHKVD